MKAMTKIGVIARADLTGLGIQSRNWVRLLNPSKVIVINSKPFNGNKQHPEWYEKYNTVEIDGFIQSNQIDSVLKDIDVLLTFEIPYNYGIILEARKRGIKTIIQNNWEFTDYLQQKHLPLPDLLVNHSRWHLEEQEKLWPEISEYCATPLFIEEFEDNYIQNIHRTGKIKFLHVAGRKTYEDRNGTQDILEAVKRIPADVDFELVIKTQTTEVECDDPRVTIDRSSPDDEKELYYDFDAMIMPRRYGGACLPMNEALASGLPVIMTDIDPNNKILPETWLVKAEKKLSFMARTSIDVYESDIDMLARRIQDFAEIDYDDLIECKLSARDIAEEEYSSTSVKRKWDLLMQRLGV